jgi:hypothetical protein
MEDYKPRKRLIIFLLSVLILFIYLLFAVLYIIPALGFSNLPGFVQYLFFTVLFGIPLLLTFMVLVLVAAIIRGKDFFLFRKVRLISIKLLYPLIVFVGNLLKIDTDKIRSSFIEINNSLLKSYKNKFKKDEMIMLIPHCLQNTDCEFKITNNINNCKKCGKCKIKDIIELCEQYDIYVSIATGGTMARKIVKDRKPRFIIAVACERDLASGIQDSYPLPVFGLPNSRPFGPCVNTDVDLDKLREAVDYFLSL